MLAKVNKNVAIDDIVAGEIMVYGSSDGGSTWYPILVDSDGVIPAVAETVKFASISASASGDNTLISAVASKKIRVLACSLVCAGAVTVRFEDGAGGAALTGQMEFAANSGIVFPFSRVGHFETTANALLNLELSDAVSVAGHLVYTEV